MKTRIHENKPRFSLHHRSFECFTVDSVFVNGNGHNVCARKFHSAVGIRRYRFFHNYAVTRFYEEGYQEVECLIGLAQNLNLPGCRLDSFRAEERNELLAKNFVALVRAVKILRFSFFRDHCDYVFGKFFLVIYPGTGDAASHGNFFSIPESLKKIVKCNFHVEIFFIDFGLPVYLLDFCAACLFAPCGLPVLRLRHRHYVSYALLGFDKLLRFQLVVSLCDRISMDIQKLGRRSFGRKRASRHEFSRKNELFHPVCNLHINWNF